VLILKGKTTTHCKTLGKPTFELKSLNQTQLEIPWNNNANCAIYDLLMFG